VRAGNWSQQAILSESDLQNEDYFGYSVALSGDGLTAAVGTPIDDTTAGADTGSVSIFTKSGSTWPKQTRFSAPDAAASDQFGWALSISNDGNTLAVGAPYDDTSMGNDAGTVWTFKRSGTAWASSKQVQASDGANADRLGVSVAMTPDGQMLVGGAPLDDNSNGVNAGSAYVYEQTASTPGADKLNLPARPDADWTWGIKT